MINRVILVGRLTKDPELRYTPSGVAVTRFTLAVNRQFKKEGEQQADFINIVVWRKAAENVANFLKKGSLAGVEGRIQTGSYEGQDGKRVYTTEVVADSVQFLESKGAQSGSQQQTQTNTQSQAQTQQRASQQQTQYQVNQNNEAFGQSNVDVQDDDLPF